ncbi:MAG: hypothetical protein R3B06_26725 [Kofleriaceae bacterium]
MHAVPTRSAAFPAATLDADLELERYATRLLQLRRWTDARTALHQLALRAPQNSRWRALLAYARGHEASELGELARARSEWERALLLDPTLDDARLALTSRRMRTTWIGRMLHRKG